MRTRFTATKSRKVLLEKEAEVAADPQPDSINPPILIKLVAVVANIYGRWNALPWFNFVLFSTRCHDFVSVAWITFNHGLGGLIG